MPIPRLHVNDTALLVIDVQERLMPPLVDRMRLAGNCAILLRMAAELDLPYVVTEQYVSGLGRTVPEVANAMSDPASRVEKTRFSALVDVVDEQLRQWRTTNVLVCGIEAHVCVLQTVLDLQATGRQAFVCTDAISAGQRDQIEPALARMSRAGAVRTGIVSAMYELLGDATHPCFRTCLDLAKGVHS
ncbi:MAG: isochorismatase family protein [Phycisphaerales bacterium]|nr:isochorismatase family protein [Phycisphaerales bacterium]